MDLRKLKTLIDLVSESNISELEITEAEGKVRIVKAGPAAAVAPAPAAMPAAGPAPAAVLPPVPVPPPAPVGKVIKAPMVGTFYRSASPGAKAFVEIGDTIAEGQAVCIIEAMKIMNEIEADCAGRVLSILCENGQAVEFGQPLFTVE
ncbi:MAG: acetyl-CoA carboxylase biotin carboxyl carrier protein [Burkholderiales bacterium]|nr:acetyl-CoA carboxylase biotin carboxyl carrier protein [Burkholderiales bacterium]